MLECFQGFNNGTKDTVCSLCLSFRDGQRDRHSESNLIYPKETLWWFYFQISCVQFQSNSDNCTFTDDINSSCLYPSYFSYFAVLILIASSLPACLSYLWKALFLFIIALGQCLVNIFVLELVLECEESRKNWNRYTRSHSELFIVNRIAFQLN